MKYRILYNGSLYRIQRKKYLFFWIYEKSMYARKEPIEFKSLDKAENYVEILQEENAEYKPISNKRESSLWKALNKD